MSQVDGAPTTSLGPIVPTAAAVLEAGSQAGPESLAQQVVQHRAEAHQWAEALQRGAEPGSPEAGHVVMEAVRTHVGLLAQQLREECAHRLQQVRLLPARGHKHACSQAHDPRSCWLFVAKLSEADRSVIACCSLKSEVMFKVRSTYAHRGLCEMHVHDMCSYIHDGIIDLGAVCVCSNPCVTWRSRSSCSTPRASSRQLPGERAHISLQGACHSAVCMHSFGRLVVCAMLTGA
jgi:hypothetical protein